MRTSPHKHRVRAVLAPRFPKVGILHARVFMFCVLRLANTGFVQCFSLGPFWVCTLVCLTNIGFVSAFPSGYPSLNVCTLMFATFVLLCVFSLTNIGFVQCLSLDPLLNLYAYLCHVMLCVLRLTNISFVQCFSLGSLLSLHAYIGHVFVVFRFTWFCGIRQVNAGTLFLFPWICLFHVFIFMF